MKKKCYDDGGLTFSEMSDEDRAAAAREAIEAINARQRPAEVEVEEKAEAVRKRPSKPAAKKEAAPKAEPKVEIEKETKKLYPDLPRPKAAETREAAMPNVAARKATTEARQRRSVFGGENKGVYGMKSGGSVSSASKRADGCAQRGKTRGRMV